MKKAVIVMFLAIWPGSALEAPQDNPVVLWQDCVNRAFANAWVNTLSADRAIVEAFDVCQAEEAAVSAIVRLGEGAYADRYMSILRLRLKQHILTGH